MQNPANSIDPEWTIIKLLEWTTSYFKSRDIESPRATAEILLAHVLELKRIDLYLRYDQPLCAEELSRFKVLIKRRVKREPVAYILGFKEFWSMDLKVTPGVFIPRPETETLVEAALTMIPAEPGAAPSTVLDLGTGSGAVVLAVAGVLIGMTVTGQRFSMIMTGTGVVALAGIVVNNAIVLIDTFNRMRSEGAETKDAVIKTAAQRLRPILLTTMTTIAGLIPMATQINLNFFEQTISVGGITAYWWVQLSTAIIFGLAFSTILTLVLIPVLLVFPSNVAALFSGHQRDDAVDALKARLRKSRRAANDDYQDGKSFPALPEAAE